MPAMVSATRESKSVAKTAPTPATKIKSEGKAPGNKTSHARVPLFLSASRGPSGAGQPMAPPLRHSIETSLRVDMSTVRIHSDARASDAARFFSARALTIGHDILLGRGESADDLGLIAHEAAHVVQQQGTTTTQAWSSRGDSFESEAHNASSAVMRGETFSVQQRTTPRVQRWGISDALNYFADKAYNIPGFRMFTIVLGVNPINMSLVERSAANVMRAVVEFMPGGALITRALDNYQIFDKVGAWVDQKMSALGMVGSSIKTAVDAFLHGLSWSDIFDLGGVWDRAKHIFTDPIDRIKKFVSGLVNDIIQFVKDAILKPLAKLAEGTRGWDLLIAVLGQNPITGEPVPRSAETLIGGFMKLIGEEEIWNNLKKANAVARAWAWFQDALNSLIGFVKEIPGLFVAAVKALEVSDIILLPNAFAKVASVFANFAGRFITWAGSAVWNLLQIIFEVVAPSVMPYLKRVGAAFKSILKNPIGFVKNLVAGAKLGFENFASNFLEHLKAGLIDWLTGSLPGVYIPKAISLAEMGKFAMSVLGISWAQIRGKIVKVLGPNGEAIMKGLETTFDVVVALVTGGPAAAWELIKEKLTNLKDMVIDGITSFVIDTIVKKAIPKLISMFIPGAGFISAIISIYDTIMVFVQKLAKIAAAVKAFVDSIVNIAEGKIDGAAKKVESTLAGLLSLAISFLAGFLGLGNIASKVLAVIEKVRAAVDKAIDTAIAWVMDKAKKLFAKLFGKKEEKPVDPDIKRRWDQGIGAAKLAAAKAKQPATDQPSLNAELSGIQSQYGFKELSAVHSGHAWKIHAVLNPEEIIEVEDEEGFPVEFIVVRVGSDAVTVRMDPTEDPVQLKQRMSALKQEEELVKGLEISRQTARNFLTTLGKDWHVGQLLMAYARTEKRGLLPEVFLREQLAMQRATSAAVARPATAETRQKLVHLGEGMEPLSDIALVFREESPGQFEPRSHPEAKMTEYIYHGPGNPQVLPLGIVQSDPNGVVVKIISVSSRVEGGEAALADLMRQVGWKVNLS